MENPVSILYHNQFSIFRDFPNLNSYQRNFVNKLLPGPITLLLPLPAETGILPYFRKNGYTGVRFIEHSRMNNILKKYNNPISTTSINPSGHEPANSVNEILQYFAGELDLIIVEEKDRETVPSTILKVEPNNYNIIREGIVSKDKIETILNRD